ncbi:MAG: septum formation initiator family protein [Deltaproteobacteria bacterium]|nr:MAG: septum formation initiator family protein [Deltaproteobacteria bacterium]
MPRCRLSVTTRPVRIGSGQVLSAALGLAIAGVAASVLLGEHGVAHLLRLRAERRALGQTAFVLMERNARLRDEIHRLHTDDLYLEGLARRQLGLVRPNEFVYRFRRD